MQILVCNDDGISSELLSILAKCLTKFGKVTVCAPNTHRSATSQAIVFEHKKEEFKLVEVKDGISYYSHPYFPTDSVLFALKHLPIKPDIIISGINIGTNVSTDIYYSGTVAIAQEAALQGYKNLALSIDKNYNLSDLDKLDEVLTYIFKNDLFSSKYVLNVNLPLGQKVFNYKVIPLFDKETENDYLNKGYVTLTPLMVNRTDISACKYLSTIIK